MLRDNVAGRRKGRTSCADDEEENERKRIRRADDEPSLGIAGRPNFQSLPTNLLALLFDKLSLEDGKSLRLTCHRMWAAELLAWQRRTRFDAGRDGQRLFDLRQRCLLETPKLLAVTIRRAETLLANNYHISRLRFVSLCDVNAEQWCEWLRSRRIAESDVVVFANVGRLDLHGSMVDERTLSKLAAVFPSVERLRVTEAMFAVATTSERDACSDFDFYLTDWTRLPATVTSHNGRRRRAILGLCAAAFSRLLQIEID